MSNSYTEEEARKKVCRNCSVSNMEAPRSNSVMGIRLIGDGGFEWQEPVCIASACMNWQWGGDSDWEEKMIKNEKGEHIHTEHSPKGYCGLARRP